ncbi:hypothetical protein KKA14_17665 [bacterium]|nr:hypothetical protein [bacterium]
MGPLTDKEKGSPHGSLAAGHDYKPEASDISVPTMGSWPLLYNMSLDAGES